MLWAGPKERPDSFSRGFSASNFPLKSPVWTTFLVHFHALHLLISQTLFSLFRPLETLPKVRKPHNPLHISYPRSWFLCSFLWWVWLDEKIEVEWRKPLNMNTFLHIHFDPFKKSHVLNSMPVLLLSSLLFFIFVISLESLGYWRRENSFLIYGYLFCFWLIGNQDRICSGVKPSVPLSWFLA